MSPLIGKFSCAGTSVVARVWATGAELVEALANHAVRSRLGQSEDGYLSVDSKGIRYLDFVAQSFNPGSWAHTAYLLAMNVVTTTKEHLPKENVAAAYRMADLVRGAAQELAMMRTAGSHWFAAITPVTPLQRVLNSVCDVWRITEEELRSHRRTTRHVLPRLAYYWIAYRTTAHSQVAIGRFLGRDHGSVCSGIRAAWDLLETVPDYVASVERAADQVVPGFKVRGAKKRAADPEVAR